MCWDSLRYTEREDKRDFLYKMAPRPMLHLSRTAVKYFILLILSSVLSFQGCFPKISSLAATDSPLWAILHNLTKVVGRFAILNLLWNQSCFFSSINGDQSERVYRKIQGNTRFLLAAGSLSILSSIVVLACGRKHKIELNRLALLSQIWLLESVSDQYQSQEIS